MVLLWSKMKETQFLYFLTLKVADFYLCRSTPNLRKVFFANSANSCWENYLVGHSSPRSTKNLSTSSRKLGSNCSSLSDGISRISIGGSSTFIISGSSSLFDVWKHSSSFYNSSRRSKESFYTDSTSDWFWPAPRLGLLTLKLTVLEKSPSFAIFFPVWRPRVEATLEREAGAKGRG